MQEIPTNGPGSKIPRGLFWLIVSVMILQVTTAALIIIGKSVG